MTIKPVVYSGNAKKGKLETLFARYCLMDGMEGGMVQSVLGIKDAVAERISSKVRVVLACSHA